MLLDGCGEQVSSKAKVTVGPKHVIFFCPGCKSLHAVPKDKHGGFNGDVEKPSFRSCIVHNMQTYKPCHFEMSAGTLHFYDNFCWHRFRNMRVRMLPVDQWFKEVDDVSIVL